MLVGSVVGVFTIVVFFGDDNESGISDRGGVARNRPTPQVVWSKIYYLV